MYMSYVAVWTRVISAHARSLLQVIEKRRRDRINHSLTELKRLVPSAFEKQGSAKLEKAEILQMTTEHLKMLQARGMNNPVSFEVDYRSMGFRECVAEVARYLASVEGMDVQNPLRLRLVSHLEAYGAQKEVALKHELSGYNTHWHRLTNYASQGAIYPTSQDATALLSSKLKEPNYGTSYTPSTPAAGYFAAQTTSLNATAGFNANALTSQCPTAFSSTAGTTNLANLSPNTAATLYGSNYITSDAYKFRPW